MSSGPKFDRAELLSFVRAIDRNLEGKVEVWVIGGAAAAIEHGASKRTADIDVIHASASLDSALEAAVLETGLPVVVSGVGIAIMPDGFESRMRRARGLHLSNLILMIPEKYDLVLSKIAADRPHDLDVVEEIHREHRLSLATLTKRFEEEVWKVSASSERSLALSFVVAVSRLFGFKEAAKLATRYGVPTPTSRHGSKDAG